MVTTVGLKALEHKSFIQIIKVLRGEENVKKVKVLMARFTTWGVSPRWDLD
jgi:hypothetical protein